MSSSRFPTKEAGEEVRFALSEKYGVSIFSPLRSPRGVGGEVPILQVYIALLT